MTSVTFGWLATSYFEGIMVPMTKEPLAELPKREEPTRGHNQARTIVWRP